MPRAFSSGALSIWSYAMNVPPCFTAITFVSAAVNVVFPWSTCPIVPTFTCGLVRANFSLDMCLPRTKFVSGCLLGAACLDDRLRHTARHFGVARKLHRVSRAALAHRAQQRRVAEHLGERHLGAHDLAGR